MDSRHAKKVLAEFKRRHNRVDILDGSFPEQIAAVRDPNKLIAVLCSRRSGKSYGAGLRMIMACLANPNTKCCYVSLSYDRCNRVMMQPILKKINRKFKLGMTFTTAPLKAQFPNGSSIVLQGVNDNEDEKNKLLGEHFKEVVLDECASFTIDMKKLIDDFIMPTLIDDQGNLTCIGTPGNIHNYFHDITTGKVPGWSNHFWLGHSNTAIPENSKDGKRMCDLFQEEIDRNLKANPFVFEDPGFQQMFLGKWTISTTDLVIKLNPERNFLQIQNSVDFIQKPISVLGIDLGEEDDNAFVIASQYDNDPTLYIQESYSENHLTMDQITDRIRHYQSKYDIYHIAIDSANKQYVEELKRRSGIHMEPAHKVGKLRYIHLLNSDLIAGRIKLYQEANTALIEQCQRVVLDRSDPYRPKIKDGQNDHLLDAFLYAWRASTNYLNTIKPTILPPTPEEQMTDYWNQKAWELQKESLSTFAERDWCDD